MEYPPRTITEEMGTTGDGRLTLVGKGSLCNKHELSLVAKRWQAFNFDAEVKVKFDPFNYQQMAGLTNFTMISTGHSLSLRGMRKMAA